MKLAIMGSGALGCYFGGRIVQSGGDVTFVARGAQLEALRGSGLTIESPLGDARIAPVEATADPAAIGPVDMVLFLVKLYDTEEAAHLMKPLLGPETAVVSFQNGIDAWERIGAVVGSERVIGGTAVIPADIRAPGIVRHSGPFAKLTFGEFDGRDSERCRSLLSLLRGAGIEAELVDDIAVKVWEKFVLLSALSAITTLTRLPIGTVLADEKSAALFRQALEETHAVGMKLCPGLGPDVAGRLFTFAKTLPPGMRASMLDDLERGKRLELDHLSGAVEEAGRRVGVPTPVHAMIRAALHPYAQGAPG